MVTLLHLLSYVGALAAFLFVTLSLASGLLWLAELIEEYSKYAKVVGMRAIYAIIALHLVLTVTDSLPVLPMLFSVACHLVYLSNFGSTWPFISLTSPRFLLSCVLVVADHFTWFFHFAHRAQEAKKYRAPRYGYGRQHQSTKDDAPPFMDVAAFFAICVWFVPLFLFLSLSANDNALPSFGDSSAPPTPIGGTIDLSTPTGGPAALSLGLNQRAPRRPVSSTPLMKSLLVPVLAMLPRLRRKRRTDEGLLAPRTPVRGSPLHSPVAMPQGYFPWSGENTPDGGAASPSASGSGSGSGSGTGFGTATGSGTYPNLSVDTANRARGAPMGATPPPPRRVQSDMLLNKGAQNPRGLATRNGKPLFEDGARPVLDGASEALGNLARRSGGAGAEGKEDPGGPAMSLGPKGEGSVKGLQIVTAPDAVKRKAD